MRSDERVDCPVSSTLQFIGGRWKATILYLLASGTKRFGDIAVRIPTISRKVLTQQLRDLEGAGLIVRKEYSEAPPRVEYSLSDLGKSLTPVFREMAAWGKMNAAKQSSAGRQ